MSYIVTADFHLRLTDSWGVNSLGVNSRLTDRLANLKTMVDYAVKNDVEGFFILGDIFDRINPPEKLRKLFVTTVINPLVKHKIPIVILMGNHDTNYDIVSFETENALMSNLEDSLLTLVIEPTILELNDGILALFNPYGFPIPGDTEAELLFGHCGVTGAETGVGVLSRPGEDIDPGKFSHFKRVYLGHYHKPQRIGNILYVGSPNIWDISERLDKKRFLEIDISHGGILEKPISLSDRKFIQLEFVEGQTWEFTQDIKDACVKAVFRGSKTWLTSLDFSAIRRDYESFLPHMVVVAKEVTGEDRVTLIQTGESVSEIDIIKRYAKETKIPDDTLRLGLQIFESV